MRQRGYSTGVLRIVCLCQGCPRETANRTRTWNQEALPGDCVIDADVETLKALCRRSHGFDLETLIRTYDWSSSGLWLTCQVVHHLFGLPHTLCFCGSCIKWPLCVAIFPLDSHFQKFIFGDCPSVSGPVPGSQDPSMSELLCKDGYNEIINREHKDVPSPIAKGKRNLFLLSRNFWNLPNLPLQPVQGSWLPGVRKSGFSMDCFQWSSLLRSSDWQTFKREKPVGVCSYAHCSF